MREVEVSEAPPPAGTAPGSRRRCQNPPITREVSPVSSETPTAIPPAVSQDDSKMKVLSLIIILFVIILNITQCFVGSYRAGSKGKSGVHCNENRCEPK